MPFTRESISQAIRNSDKAPKKGEEGILHQITLNNKGFYAKEWRGKHFEGPDISRKSYSYEDESKMTPVSPFWFKLKYYEGLLLNTAFPEQTLRVHAAYDPRIETDGKTSYFIHGSERPVTLATAIESGSDAQKNVIRSLTLRTIRISPTFSQTNTAYSNQAMYYLLRSSNLQIGRY